MKGDYRYLCFNNADSTFSGGLIQESGPTLVGQGSTVMNGVLVKGPVGTGSPADVVLANWFAGSGVVRVVRPATVIFVF